MKIQRAKKIQFKTEEKLNKLKMFVDLLNYKEKYYITNSHSCFKYVW